MGKKIGVNRTVLKTISNGDLEISFVATGDIHTIKHKNIFLNQLIGQEIDGSITNIYLRIFEINEIKSYPLLGKNSDSRFWIGKSQAKWTGRIADISYEVKLSLTETSWFWEVRLDGVSKKVDVVYVNDIGLADGNALRSNEAYNAQYINHQVFEEGGYKLFSRQNQVQSTGFPTLETGAFGDLSVTGYLTDGFQFFGKSFKQTRKPEALEKIEFDNEVYQYEMSLIALKTEAILLNGQKSVTFYELYQADSKTLKNAPTHDFPHLSNEDLIEVSLTKPKVKMDQQLNGRLLSNEELRQQYPNAKFEEVANGQILSGFTQQNTHFVSLAKELIVEREHGEIFLSGNSKSIKNRGIATSSFIYGLFNAQLVIGNTNMNKLLSNQRDHLNLHQVSGQRIFVKVGNDYQMLGIPSTFEMGYNFAEWTYVLPDDTLIVRNFAANQENSIQLEIESQSGKIYEFLFLNQVIMDEMEYKSELQVNVVDSMTYEFTAGEDSASQIGNPALRYQMVFSQPVGLLESEHLFDGTTFIEDGLVIFKVKANQLKVKMTGSLDGNIEHFDFLDFVQEKQKYKVYIENQLLNQFRFTSKHKTFEKLNTILPWYTHDMLIHYLSPHGLEQYGGAAWGTRDVSQGPLEFFLATQQPEVAREILLELFSHQFEDDGTWPQWFMFDEYQPIFSDESHGDVIVWPFFAVAEYLEQTGDFSLLREQVPFVSRSTQTFTEQTFSFDEHLQKELQYIKNHFLKGTYLSAYGNGDWDDTLQPANSELKEHMTSSWTDALTYQALQKFAQAIREIRPDESKNLIELAKAIKADFEKYLIPEGTISGFALQNRDGSFEAMIHPKDKKTNIQYRLLPMNRSIIAEVADNEQMEHNLELIEQHLIFNDGVRLMNHSPAYHGGISTHFKRAEQAANFGREIGLLYVHAQIRYVEAMAKVGRAKEAWKALEQTIPVGLQEVVNNAEPRQANVYFSSSDGDFKTRYAAQENFDKLKSGNIGVKGGWRLYSSGPGIFTNQVIAHLAGIEMTASGLKVDPVFPEDMDEVCFDFNINGKNLHFNLSKGETYAAIIDNQLIDSENVYNPYRKSGILIKNSELLVLRDNSSIYITV
ncbi:GH36-type glycosyl hydrolase domain-containing protein [Lactococcus allomyrinae]|uniref:Cellobiose phosphorylase n=1 Tax=Lactococcus allomyrinae TaxID=2419773 RepID=A0A387B9X6_9LACT|nr:amylo-alpha-1,6-glucosidase [Lactococcus allomyrinae]AYG00645.1 cellobiose phosphorylase [Lactococcus allomyrinae]